MKNWIAVVFISAAVSFSQTEPVEKNPIGTVKQPQPTTITVTPKESISTVKLELAESNKKTLASQRQLIINNANAQLTAIGKQLDKENESEKDLMESIRKENGWDARYSYVPPQDLPDGSSTPAKWIKTEKKP